MVTLIKWNTELELFPEVLLPVRYPRKHRMMQGVYPKLTEEADAQFLLSDETIMHWSGTLKEGNMEEIIHL